MRLAAGFVYTDIAIRDGSSRLVSIYNHAEYKIRGAPDLHPDVIQSNVYQIYSLDPAHLLNVILSGMTHRDVFNPDGNCRFLIDNIDHSYRTLLHSCGKKLDHALIRAAISNSNIIRGNSENT